MKALELLLIAGLVLLKITLVYGQWPYHNGGQSVQSKCDRPCDVGYYLNTKDICFKKECTNGDHCYISNEQFEEMKPRKTGANSEADCRDSCVMSKYQQCQYFSYSRTSQKCLGLNVPGNVIFAEGNLFRQKICSQPFESYKQRGRHCHKAFKPDQDSINKCKLALRELVYSSTKFEFPILKKVIEKSEDGNAAMGSFGVLNALSFFYSMVANGNSFKILREKVFTGIHPEEVKFGMKHLIQDLSSQNQFTTVNKLFTTSGVQLKSDFRREIKEVFQAEFENLNTKQSPVDVINTWVSDQIEVQNPIILAQGTSNNLTDAAIYVGAQFLKPEWENPFNPENSYDGTFTSKSSEFPDIRYMKRTGLYKVADGPSNSQILEVPLKGNKMRMLFILPHEGEEDQFGSQKNFDVSSLKFRRESNYEIHIPEFTIETNMNESVIISGFPAIQPFFDPQSGNFGKMANNLITPKFLHKTILTVDDGFGNSKDNNEPDKVNNLPTLFKLNRPFFYVVQDVQTQIVLVSGKVSKPKLDPKRKEELRVARVTQKLTSSASKFELPLLQTASKHSSNGNAIIGSMSILSTLSFLYSMAADGDTLDGLKESFFTGMEPDEVRDGMKNLTQRWSNNNDNRQLKLAKRLFKLSDVTFKDNFEGEIKEAFNTDIEDLKDSPNPAKEINSWVSEKTEGKIDTIIPKDSLPSSGVILASALYLKAKWQVPFNPQLSHQGYFHSSYRHLPNVKYMSRRGQYRVADGPSNAKTLEIPFEDNKLRMLFVLPNQIDDANFDSIENNPFTDISSLDFGEETEYDIQIPAFYVETSIDVDKVALDFPIISDLFNPEEANFNKMADDMVISKILHKTFLNIDEEGVEAGSVGVAEFMVINRVESFTVNRPFFFVLQDVETGIVIFVGKIKEPIVVSSTNEPDSDEYDLE